MTEEPRCKYPGCKHVAEQAFNLPVKNTTDNDGTSVAMDFCNYHFYIIAAGQFFAIYRPISDVFEIHGPFEQVEIAEAVLAAARMVEEINRRKAAKA